MANHSSHRRTMKCSVIKKGPHFGLWIWCTVLFCLIRLPCILTRCYPGDGHVYVPFGNPMELLCIADNPQDPNYDPKNLKFLLNSTEVNDTELVNTTTRRLFIRHPEKAVKTYHCRNNKEKCVIRTVVDSKPMDVTDFRCISHNLMYLMCNWTIPLTQTNINYSIAVEFQGSTLDPVAVVPENESSNTRYWKWENFYRQQVAKFYIIVNGTNVFGSNIQNITIDHFSIVKPYAPSDLEVLNIKSHQVLLRWKIPNTMADLLDCGVDHRIEYQIEKTTEFRSVNASSLPKKNNRIYTFSLINLPYAHMMYEVRIYIRSRKAREERFWSDYTYKVFTTESEAPKRPPETIAGAFSETEFDTNRNLIIYWKQLEEVEEAGANFIYVVNITQNGETYTKEPYKNTSLSYLRLENVPYSPMLVSVTSVNEIGSSVNSSHLYIPSKTDSKLKVTTFSQIAYDGNMYKLSWIGNHDIDNYTLFWCQHNVTNLCNGRLNFTVLNASSNIYNIRLPKRDRYQFAISANKGMNTSGIIWATCDISNDTLPLYGFPVKIEKEGYQGKTYVNIKWSLTCSIHLEENQTTIKGYRITYCVGLKTSSECDPSYNSKDVIIHNPRQMEKNITELLPHKTYLFRLSIDTVYGWKELTSAITETTTLEDTPTSPRNVEVSEVTSNSMVLSFDPPDPRNGIIGNYTIYNYGSLHKTIIIANDNEDIKRRNVNVTDLDAFTTYGWTVIACNMGINSCSPPAPKEPIVRKTKIGKPSKLKPPQVLQDRLEWISPDIQGGNDTFYEIKIVKDNHDTNETEKTPNTIMPLLQCVNVRYGEKYLVRAVNRDGFNLHQGEWSDPSSNTCSYSDNTTMVIVFLTLFSLIGIAYGCLKLYHKYIKMDIKPDLPKGLCIPEPEKYTFGGWNPSLKDNKSSADETLPLTAKNAVSLPEVKQKENSNCDSIDHTDSTALSDISRGPVDRHPSTSDDDSNSSLHLEGDPAKVDHIASQEEYSFINSDNDSLDAFNDKPFKTGPVSIANPTAGYVQSVPSTFKSAPPKPPSETASSSYVKAGLSPSIFTTGVIPPPVKSHPPTSSGYVLREDANSLSNLPNYGPPTSMPFGPDSLPTLPTLPQPAKHAPDSSYIQLQSLDSLPSLKPSDRNIVPSCKPPAPSISPGDAVINKHFNNMMSAGQMVEEPAILDPKMSPDAYCRFSWSTDPANDNLQSLYSPNINSYKN